VTPLESSLRRGFSTLQDFNAVPDSHAYRAFQAEGYVDSCSVSPDADQVSTYHDFEGADFPHTGLRIDWILVKDGARQFAIRQHQVILDAQPPLHPSDHYPVLAELEMI
jgi:endonuclease/exonuclease/phosphatase family metal-dependent hydrolase